MAGIPRVSLSGSVLSIGGLSIDGRVVVGIELTSSEMRALAKALIETARLADLERVAAYLGGPSV